MIDMPGSLIEALCVRPKVEWERLFDAMITDKCLQMPAQQGADQLLVLQAKVASLQETKAFFIDSMSKAPSERGGASRPSFLSESRA